MQSKPSLLKLPPHQTPWPVTFSSSDTMGSPGHGPFAHALPAPSFKWLAKFNWGMTTYRETFHLFLLPTFFSFHSHSSFGFSKITPGALTTMTGCYLSIAHLKHCVLWCAAPVRAFILCIPVPGTAWLTPTMLLNAERLHPCFHSCTVISSMMSTWDFRICLIPTSNLADLYRSSLLSLFIDPFSSVLCSHKTLYNTKWGIK